MNVIDICNLSKNYNHQTVLKNINLSIKKGDIVLLVGHNGSGKSTLMKCILNHIAYDGFLFCGEDEIGYVPEKAILPDFMRVEQFIQELNRIKKNYQIDIDSLLEKYKLLDKKNKLIATLSKGMKQKVMIMQSFLGNPKLYLFDEPLNGLDEESIQIFMTAIQSLLNQKYTIIIATHSPNLYQIKQKRVIEFHQGAIHEIL